MNDVSATNSIVVERTLPHPPEKVWKALTRSDLIARWLMTNDFEPRLARRFNFRAKPIPGMWNGVTDCEVIELEEPHRLAYSWNASGEEAQGGLQSTVTWTLTPVAGGTHVRMAHTGFRPEDETGRQAMGGGWPRIVERLGEIAGEL